MNKIDSFSGEFRFLSNFYMCDVMFDGLLYPSSEHAYVAAKTTDIDERLFIQKIVKLRDVKTYGRSELVLRPDWDNLKTYFMHSIVIDKFERNEDLRELLLATGDAYLEEGNHWGDTYWGVCDGVGSNWLGRVLMNVREGCGGIGNPKALEFV